MKTRIFLTAIAAMFLISGCNVSEPEQTIEDDGLIRISAIHPGQTKVSDTGFDNGDNIGVFITDYEGAEALPLQISGNRGNNISTVYNGSNWTAEKPAYWGDDNVDVYAYFPYSESVNSIPEYKFSVQLDQNSYPAGELSGYEASDFLWAKAENVAPQTAPVEMQFKHVMSKLVVKLKKGEDYEGELPDNAIIRIHNTIPDALIDLETGMPATNSYSRGRTINCKKLSVDTFTAIIVPQRIPSVMPLIEVEADNVSYLIESTFNFRPGMVHTFTLTINTPPGKILIDIGGQIDDTWN